MKILAVGKEPTDDFEGGLKTLENEIKQFKPDVVIGCSRGAKYVMELLCTNIYSGPTLLISAMTMSKQVPQCVPVIFAHGIKDVTIPIFTVEASASSGSKEICKVKQYEDDHSLHCLEETDEFGKLILEVFEMKNIKVEKKKKLKNPMVMRGGLFSEIKSLKKQ